MIVATLSVSTDVKRLEIDNNAYSLVAQRLPLQQPIAGLSLRQQLCAEVFGPMKTH